MNRIKTHRVIGKLSRLDINCEVSKLVLCWRERERERESEDN
jgi:hypothetical protein